MSVRCSTVLSRFLNGFTFPHKKIWKAPFYGTFHHFLRTEKEGFELSPKTKNNEKKGVSEVMSALGIQKSIQNHIPHNSSLSHKSKTIYIPYHI